MTEIRTFSAAVDDVVQRTGRLDRKADIISYLRASMRESQVLAFFQRDMTEDQLTATADPYTWLAPPETIRRMLHVEYPSLLDAQGKKICPKYMPPGKSLSRATTPYFYYNGPDYWVFAGMGGNDPGDNPLINISYLSYFNPLAYYATVADRPATYSLEDLAWTYKTATTDTEKEAARAQVTNWMLFNHYDLVVEGGMTKLLKSTNDPRHTTSFALYKSYQKTMLAGEVRLAPSGDG